MAHLDLMHRALVLRGIPAERIQVLASDGDGPGVDATYAVTADPERAWRLEGTSLQKALGAPVRRVNTTLRRSPTDRADKSGVVAAFRSLSKQLRPGDTLFVFVTDHGARGATPEETMIVLWDREQLSVRELAAHVGTLAKDVRVVLMMSQCFSGGFAELAFERLRGARPAGATCGYFSTTATRVSFGCTPEVLAGKQDGHAFRFIAGLERQGSPAGAHAEALLTDQTPDVPVRTSDVFLSRWVEARAKSQGRDVDALIAERLGRAQVEGQIQDPEAPLISALETTFSIPLPTTAVELKAVSERVAANKRTFDGSAALWQQAVGELGQAKLEAFLKASPKWAAEAAPERLARLGPSRLEPLQTAFLNDLTAFSNRAPVTEALWRAGRARLTAARSAAARGALREAALLRLRTLLISSVGRQLLEESGRPEERAELSALRACEATPLPSARPWSPPPQPTPLPSVASDERLIRAVIPGLSGLLLSRGSRGAAPVGPLPEGAARVTTVDARATAARAGLRVGDIVLGLAGAPPPERGALELTIALAGQQGAVALDLLRDGRPLRISFDRPETLDDGAPVLPAGARAALEGLRPVRGDAQTVMSDGRPYLLFFWATWCTYCKDAVPELLALEKARGVRIVSISPEERPPVEAFLAVTSKPFPEVVALDANDAVTSALDISGYPTFIYVDANGRIRARSSGYNRRLGLEVPGWTWSERPKGVATAAASPSPR